MNNYEDVKQSFARCMIKGDVVGRFYEIFLASHPDIEPRFAHTDFDSQKHLLRQSVNLAIMFASDNQIGKKGINRIRQSHSKLGLNIPPELYTYWKISFLQAASEFDEEFSDDLKSRWDSVLQKTINFIIEGYDG